MNTSNGTCVDLLQDTWNERVNFEFDTKFLLHSRKPWRMHAVFKVLGSVAATALAGSNFRISRIETNWRHKNFGTNFSKFASRFCLKSWSAIIIMARNWFGYEFHMIFTAIKLVTWVTKRSESNKLPMISCAQHTSFFHISCLLSPSSAPHAMHSAANSTKSNDIEACWNRTRCVYVAVEANI